MKILTLIVAGLLVVPAQAVAAEEEAVLGAGCFWCVEAVYEKLPGVKEVISGYAGGVEKDPTYQQVSRGKSTHAEVVKIIYDPEVITYDTLIEWFWKIHDATDPRGVWPDFGPQYRSTILYSNDAQKSSVEKAIAQQNAAAEKPIATEVKPLDVFYPAEEYHQDYVRLNPQDRYVRNIAIPKLKKVGLAP